MKLSTRGTHLSGLLILTPSFPSACPRLLLTRPAAPPHTSTFSPHPNTLWPSCPSLPATPCPVAHCTHPAPLGQWSRLSSWFPPQAAVPCRKQKPPYRSWPLPFAGLSTRSCRPSLCSPLQLFQTLLSALELPLLPGSLSISHSSSFTKKAGALNW